MNILVTGSAGFIGHHLVKKLTGMGHKVLGLDNLNNYYDVRLKYARLKNQGFLEEKFDYGKYYKNSVNKYLEFVNINLEDLKSLNNAFESYNFDIVCNLAAQAGVRYSLDSPQAYIESNITGFLNILECCRFHKPQNVVYASSSSVYGINKKLPFHEDDPVDHPISLYAATKRANELFAHTYSNLFGLRTNGLRFFTVYGPWGRPDMALFKFTKAAIDGSTIKVFNHGEMSRDFTYIDDIVDGIERVLFFKSPDRISIDEITSSTSTSDFRVFNIGRGQPVSLLKFIELIEKYTKKEIKKEFLPMQDGDVKETFADTSNLKKETGYNPSFSVEEGVKRFIEWYINFYK